MHSLVSIKKTIRDLLMYVLLFVSAVSYHPTIVQISHQAGYETGTFLSKYIILLFVFVLLLSINTDTFKQSSLVQKYLVCLVIIFIVGLAVYTFFNNEKMLNEIRTFVIVLGAVFIGYDLKIDDKRLALLILIFSLPTMYSGLMQILVNIGGFQIMDQYLADSKNSLGGMLATVCLSLYYLSRCSTKKLLRLACLFLSIFVLVIMVTIRARMAMLSLICVGFFYYYLLKRDKSIFINLLLLSVAALVFFFLLPDSILNYVELSMVAGSQGEDFSSGRLETYKDAINYLSLHPFLGNIYQDNHIGWVHNYLLLKLYDFGILFFWPILVLYFLVLIRSITNSFHYAPKDIRCFGCVCLLIPYVISLAEPTYPFGPGTVTVFNFILFGIAEKQIDNYSYIE